MKTSGPESGVRNDEALHLAAGFSSEPPGADFEIRPLAEVERVYIETVISLCGGNIPRAARALRVSPSTIYRKKARWKGPSVAVDSGRGAF